MKSKRVLTATARLCLLGAALGLFLVGEAAWAASKGVVAASSAAAITTPGRPAGEMPRMDKMRLSVMRFSR